MHRTVFGKDDDVSVSGSEAVEMVMAELGFYRDEYTTRSRARNNVAEYLT